jgi:hypothetical protein
MDPLQEGVQVQVEMRFQELRSSAATTMEQQLAAAQVQSRRINLQLRRGPLMV